MKGVNDKQREQLAMMAKQMELRKAVDAATSAWVKHRDALPDEVPEELERAMKELDETSAESPPPSPDASRFIALADKWASARSGQKMTMQEAAGILRSVIAGEPKKMTISLPDFPNLKPDVSRVEAVARELIRWDFTGFPDVEEDRDWAHTLATRIDALYASQPITPDTLARLEELEKSIGPDLGMFIAQWAAQQQLGVEQEALSTLVVRRVRGRIRSILAAAKEAAG